MESAEPQIGNTVLLYFTTPECHVCKVILPKLRQLLASRFPKLKLHVVDVSSNRDLAVKFQIFTVPVILLFFDGKLFARKVRNFSILEIENEIERPYELFFH